MTAHLVPEQMSQSQNEAANPHQSAFAGSPRSSREPESTPTLLRASTFAHARDNQPRPLVVSWEDLKTRLNRVYCPQPGNPGGDPKRSMPAICPAFFAPGSRRGRESALGVSLLILDFDNSREEPTGEMYPIPRSGRPSNRPKNRKIRIEVPVGMFEVTATLGRLQVASMAWTTFSCTPEHEKFRVLIPLAYPVPVDSWERAAEWSLAYLDLNPYRRGIDLPVLHNPCALAFLPGGLNPFAICRAETAGDPLAIPLKGLPPVSPPTLAPWQEEALATRRTKQAQGERWWSAFRQDGHLVDFRSLDLASILESRGIKVGGPQSFKDGTKRRCSCPWASEHSGGLDDDSAVVIQTPGTWPSFRCMHSGHAHMGLRDLLEWAWGRP